MPRQAVGAAARHLRVGPSFAQVVAGYFAREAASERAARAAQGQSSRARARWAAEVARRNGRRQRCCDRAAALPAAERASWKAARQLLGDADVAGWEACLRGLVSRRGVVAPLPRAPVQGRRVLRGAARALPLPLLPSALGPSRKQPVRGVHPLRALAAARRAAGPRTPPLTVAALVRDARCLLRRLSVAAPSGSASHDDPRAAPPARPASGQVLRLLLLLAGVEPNPGPPKAAKVARKAGGPSLYPCPCCPADSSEPFSELWLLVEHMSSCHGPLVSTSDAAAQVRAAGARICGRCGLAALPTRRCDRCFIGALIDASPEASAAAAAGRTAAAAGGVAGTRQLDDAAVLSALLDLLRQRCTTMRHVPAAVREDVAAELAGLLTRATFSPEAPALASLLLFPRVVLAALPKRQAAVRGVNVAEVVAQRLRQWRCDLPPALASGLPAGCHAPASGPRVSAAVPLPADKLVALITEGFLGKASRALTPSVVLDSSVKEVADKLVALHPPAGWPCARPPCPTPLVASEAAVMRAARGLRRSEAHGPDGLRADHLWQCLTTAGGVPRAPLLAALTRFVSAAAAGRLPEAWAPALCAASLHAFAKKNAGVRPIAVAALWVKLVSTVVLEAADTASLDWDALQWGVGVRNGADVAIHSARIAAARARQDPSRVCLKVDLVNAFNAVDRSRVVQSAGATDDALATWAFWSLARPSLLATSSPRGPALFSAQGVRQGDPVSPLLFSTAIHGVVKEVQSVAGGVSCWYLDDGFIEVCTDRLQLLLDTLSSGLSKLGLALNASKSELLCAEAAARSCKTVAQCGIPRPPVEEWELLGSPLVPEAAARCFQKRAAAVSQLLDAAAGLGDPHSQMRLLVSCLGTPRMAYLLRTTPPGWVAQQGMERLDAVLQAGLQDILGALSPEALAAALLPTRMGGLGIPLPSFAAPAWFVDAALQVTEQVRAVVRDPHVLPIGLTDTLRASPAIVAASPHFLAVLQDPAAKVVPPKAADTLRALYEARPRGPPGSRQDRLARAASGVVRPWLLPPRVGDRPVHLAPREFVALARFCIGQPVYDADPLNGGACTCRRCGFAAADVFGDHAVGCRYGGERTRRHTRLRDAVGTLCSAAGFQWVPEAPVPATSLTDVPLRPADLLVPSWPGGPLAIDVTVAHPLCASAPDMASSTAASRAEARKLTKYAERCKAAGWQFVPFAVSSFGQRAPRANAFCTVLCSRLASRLACSRAEASRLVDSALASAVALGVAEQLVSHAPPPVLPAALDLASPPAAPFVQAVPGDDVFRAASSPPGEAAAPVVGPCPALVPAPAGTLLMEVDEPHADATPPPLQPTAQAPGAAEPVAARSGGSPMAAVAAAAQAAAAASSAAFKAARATFAH